MAKYVCIFLSSVVIASLSQVLLKKSALSTCESKIKEYLNVKVISAYTLFFASSLITIYAYKGVPLSMGPILEASGYLWVTLLSAFLLKEKANARKIIGLLVIVAGIIIFAI